jgi:hypothetical protein
MAARNGVRTGRVALRVPDTDARTPLFRSGYGPPLRVTRVRAGRSRFEVKTDQ